MTLLDLQARIAAQSMPRVRPRFARGAGPGDDDDDAPTPIGDPVEDDDWEEDDDEDDDEDDEEPLQVAAAQHRHDPGITAQSRLG
jgi:hypothetical protein